MKDFDLCWRHKILKYMAHALEFKYTTPKPESLINFSSLICVHAHIRKNIVNHHCKFVTHPLIWLKSILPHDYMVLLTAW